MVKSEADFAWDDVERANDINSLIEKVQGFGYRASPGCNRRDDLMARFEAVWPWIQVISVVWGFHALERADRRDHKLYLEVFWSVFVHMRGYSFTGFWRIRAVLLWSSFSTFSHRFKRLVDRMLEEKQAPSVGMQVSVLRAASLASTPSLLSKPCFTSSLTSALSIYMVNSAMHTIFSQLIAYLLNKRTRTPLRCDQ